jgi:hypothetical protein
MENMVNKKTNSTAIVNNLLGKEWSFVVHKTGATQYFLITQLMPVY